MNLTRKMNEIRESNVYFDRVNHARNGTKELIMKLFRFILIAGVSYVILAPMIGILTSSFFSDSDRYNPIVFTIPINPTLERYSTAMEYLDYWKTLGTTVVYTLLLTLIQVFVCSMVGYGFARFEFKLKKILFACVILMIVLPIHTVMLPLYVTFRNFGIGGGTTNLMGTWWPVTIMSCLGTGLSSGLYIYIFNQFFRGLPKEIEEAAFVDGAGTWYTYFRIMLVNAMPALITVIVFSLVWQYNDTFYASLFNVPTDTLLSKRISTLMDTISNVKKIYDPSLLTLYLNAGIVLIAAPLVLIYIVLQKQFIEGVERSGIVG